MPPLSFENESIGQLAVSGTDDSLRQVRDISKSIEEMQGFVTKLGDGFDRVGGYLKELTTQNSTLLTSLGSYSIIMDKLNSTTKELLDSNSNIVTSLSQQGTHQDSLLSKAGQQLDLTRKRIEEEETAAKKKQQEEIAKIAGGIKHPGAAVGGELTNLVPELAIAVAVAAAAKGAFDTYRGYEKIAAAGGTTLEGGFGNVSNFGKFNMESKFNEFMGYASKEESGGALSTLMGKGGLRGDELIHAFDGLGKAAENAGMKLGEMANISAILARRYAEETSTDPTASKKDILMPLLLGVGKAMLVGNPILDTKAAIDTAKETAEEKRVANLPGYARALEYVTAQAKTTGEHFDVKEIAQAVAEISSNAVYAKNAANMFGIEPGGEQVIKKLYDSFEQYEGSVYEGILTQKEYNAVYIEGMKLNKTRIQIENDLKDVLDKSRASGETGTAYLGYKAGLTQKYTPYSEDTVAAQGMAIRVLSDFFVDGLKKGRYSIDTFNSAVDEWTTKFGQTPEAIRDFSMKFDKMGKEIGVSGKVIMANVGSITKDLIPIIKDPAEALKVSTEMMTKDIAKLIEHNQITPGQISSIMKTQIDVFKDGTESASDKLKGLATVVANTAVRMDDLTSFITSNAAAMRRFGVGETEMATSRTAFDAYLKEGSVSLQDFTNYLKGPLAASEGVKEMAYSSLSEQNTPLGRIAKKAGPIGFLTLLTDITAAAQSGVASKALEADFGPGKTKGFYTELQDQIKESIVGTKKGVLGGVGGNKYEERWIHAMLFPEDIGTSIGAGSEAMAKGSLTVNREAINLEVMKTIKAHGDSFGEDVGKFSEAVNAFMGKAGVHISTTGSTKGAPRKTQSITPGISKGVPAYSVWQGIQQ